MDDEINDGPFAVWQMFNAPTLVLFDNLELAGDGLERLLQSILKLSGDFSEVLVPRPGTKYPDVYYSSFNTWLIGRLFYVWSVKKLDRIHLLSKDAQLKLMSIVCINDASFYKPLHLEYINILLKSIEYYKNESNHNQKTHLVLKNFDPELNEIQESQLNLQPIFVDIDSVETCKRLIDLTLQLLSENIPLNSIQIDEYKNVYEEVFTNVLYMLECYSMDLKISSLKFFVVLITKYNEAVITQFHKKFPNACEALIYNVEALVQMIQILFEKGEVDVMSLKEFIQLIGNFLRLPLVYEEEYCEVTRSICSEIISMKNSKMFPKELILQCLSFSKQIKFPENIISLQSMDASEIEMVTDCFCKNLQENSENMKDLNENWYYIEIMSVIKSLKYCEDNIDMFVISYHLQRCSWALHILQSVLIANNRKQGNNGSNINILGKDSAVTIWKSLLKLIELHSNKLVTDCDIVNIVMDITLSTIILNKNITLEEKTMVLQILCLQVSKEISVNNLNYDDDIKLLVLKYLMVAQFILKVNNSLWSATISFLINSLSKNKPVDISRQLIAVTPLILLNKIYSASRLIAEILMPNFLNKDIGLQLEITRVIPAIVCMSMGNHNIAVSTKNSSFSHTIFKSATTSIFLKCSNCHRLVENNENMVLNCENNLPSSGNTTTISGLRNLIAKFLNYNQYIDIEKSAYWDMVARLCNHFYVFTNGLPPEIGTFENSHHILKALHPFTENNLVDTDPVWNSHRDTAFNLCVNLLVKATKTSLESNDYSKQSHTLAMIKEFGLIHNDKVVLPVTKLLVYFIMHPQCSLSPKAVLYLGDVCEAQGFTPNQIYHRYKKDYCKLFVECSLHSGKEFTIGLLKVVRAFGFVGYRDFISKDIHHYLPYLIPYSVTVREVPSMVEDIACLVQFSTSSFLTEKFPHIYVHIYLNETNEVAKKCYEILERLTKTSILNLIKKHYRVILTEFLLQYCCNPEKVLQACRYLACHDPEITGSGGSSASMNMSTSAIADFLNPKFLGVLAYFDHKLVNAKVALSVKRKALKSFPDIIQLMGVKYLTPLRYKVLATLRSALPLAKEFPTILAEAWGAFIHNIDSMSLGPLLSNLAVSLLQQLEFAPQEINKIFQYLVLSNENLLSSHISDLFFVDDVKISERVKMVIKKHVKRTQPEGFLDKIKWYLQHLNQDIPKIKAYAFNHLDKLLKNNRTEIHKAIFGGKNIDPVIVELIDSLLLGCKDPDAQVSAGSGRCLGQLGAIEAGHLPRRYVQPDRSPFAFSIADNCFAATALVELSRAFQYEKDTMNMDCYALTIQEILKMYEISPTGSKKDVWDSFPEHMHQIMFPLLSSRYILANCADPKKAHPLFGSQYATTFLEWAHNWAGQLIPLIESESIRDLLRTVHPSMRRDGRTLFLFLPYVLLHAVMSKNNAQYIREEMLAVVGLENFKNDPVPTDKSRYKILRDARMTPNVNSFQAEEGNQTKCSKTIYTLLDFLNRWILEWCNSKQRPMENENYKAISSFLEKFDKLSIARGNFLCGELERALQYLELYMDENKDNMQDQLPLLAEIYALLDEPDSVAGILSIKRSEPSLKELILAQVVTGRLQDAALCYERLAQEGQLDRHSLQGMIDCYLGLDQPFTAYRLLSEHETEDSMMELAAEPLWRLGRFEQLEEIVKKPVPVCRENWGLQMGRILLAYRASDHDAFETSCNDAATRLLSQMDGESKGESALRSGYQSVLGLHIIAEARHSEEVLRRIKDLEDGDKQGSAILDQMLDEWRRRLAVVQSDVRTVEPLLRLRRILLQQSQELLKSTHPSAANTLKACIGDLWLQSAKHARKAGILQQSYMYILNAEEYRPEELFIEKAKMYWARGQHESAFTTLRRGLDDAYPNLDQLSREQKKICAKAKLLIAKYNDETTNVDVDVNIGYYKESVEVFKQWEKSLVCLGSYYEKVSTPESTSNMTLMRTRKLHALNCYGKALQFGHKYLYQSMPRMLSIWLDMEVTSHDTSAHSVLAQMTEIINIYSEKLPLYLYLSAFSQIVSRICHPVIEVYQQLKAIIVKLILAYPQHTLWMMMCVIKSSYPQRMKRCADVFSDPRLKEPHMLKLVSDFTLLAEKLIELCNKPITTSESSTTVSSLVRTLPRLLASDGFSRIMMPFERFCKVTLPAAAARQERADCSVPVQPPVHIAGVEEQVTILPSLQKPRKVTLRGSDGKAYIIMLKPRDDLRKDFRLMEFNAVVNRFLQDAAETRRRRLYIRTYSVLPLNEECGLIEWVPHLLGLRPILMHIYKQKGLHTSTRELKQIMCSNKDPIEKKRRMFEDQLLPRHPPVFQEWFRRLHTSTRELKQIMCSNKDPIEKKRRMFEDQLLPRHPPVFQEWFRRLHTSTRELKQIMCSNKDPIEKKRRMFEDQLLPRHPPVFQEWFRRVFSDPYGWYQARSAYIRTTAVMSMVGYILGLGDRHGENISFDSTNGDTVHVDFNCLFNKGESFDWPERVPFRLTHNMESAMGPLKHEGMYRKSCEAVMRALRAQTAALMSVIGPFVYDPLVSWGRSRPIESGERTNEQAMQHLQHIRQRLNGMVRTKNKQLSLSLSPEGQVEHLIVEATSIHNLCQMYIGWGPYL